MRRGAIFGTVMLLLMLAAAGPAPAQGAGDCKAMKQELAKLDAAIRQLEDADLPDRIAEQMTAVIDELIDALEGTKGDLEHITGKLDKAKKKLEDVAKKLAGAKGKVPPALGKLKDALGKFAEDIESGVKKFTKGAGGQVAEGLEQAGKYIDSVVGTLKQIKSGIEDAQALRHARDGSGADQVRALKVVFDNIRSATGADEVPGVKQLFDAYSQALDGIAGNVAAIEAATRAKIKDADAALQGTDFGPIDNLYPGMQDQKEKVRSHLEALRTARENLQKELDDNDCGQERTQPAAAKDPCTDPAAEPARTRKVLDGMTQQAREAYEAARRNYDNLVADLADHAFRQPQPPLPQNDPTLATLDGYAAELARLERAERANNPSAWGYGANENPVNRAREIAARLGVEMPAIAAGDWRRGAQAWLPKLKQALAAKRQAAEAEADRGYAAAVADWEARRKQLAAAAGAAGKALDAAKAAWRKALADALNKEADAKQWSKAQRAAFEECYPDYRNLTRQASCRGEPAPPAGGKSIVQSLDQHLVKPITAADCR